MDLNINGKRHRYDGNPEQPQLRAPEPTDEDIDRLHGNLCRCGTYYRMRRALHRAAGYLKAEA